jgi:hypothetical protein
MPLKPRRHYEHSNSLDSERRRHGQWIPWRVSVPKLAAKYGLSTRTLYALLEENR